MGIIERNNVTVLGSSGQPMVFAHGFGCDQNMWRLVYPAFQDEHRIVLFDYVGAGRSDLSAYSSERYGSLQGYARDIIEICDALDVRGGVFVGHSVSSMIGILASTMRPDLFASLVFVGPSPRYIDEAATGYVGGFSRADIDTLLATLDDNYLGWSRSMAPVFMHTPDRPELNDELINSFCRTDPAIAKEFAHVTFSSDNRADLARVAVPSLIIQATNDVIAPVEVGEYMHRVMPQSELVTIEASGHCLNLSEPQAVIAAIRSFLARRTSPSVAGPMNAPVQ